jgi:hypothetical protein
VAELDLALTDESPSVGRDRGGGSAQFERQELGADLGVTERDAVEGSTERACASLVGGKGVRGTPPFGSVGIIPTPRTQPSLSSAE